MSKYQPLVDITLAVFQMSAEVAGQAFGVAEVTTHAHCPSGGQPLYYCRYQLPGRALACEAPAARTTTAAVRALRAALANQLGPAPSAN